jgi:hypothetical protein
MSAVALIVLIIVVVGIISAILFILGYGIKHDAQHRRRLGRRDRARAQHAKRGLG